MVAIAGWLAIGARATAAVDAEVDRFQARAETAFAGTDLAHMRKLAHDAMVGGTDDERRLAAFLAQPGRAPRAFFIERGDYVAHYQVESWGTERTVEVEWDPNGVTVTTHV